MTDSRDPIRLHDDPATSDELRDAIGALREGGRDERSRATVAAGLGSLLEDPAAPPGESTPGSSGGATVSGATRALLVGGAVTGALVLLLLLDSGTPEPEATPAAPVPADTSTAIESEAAGAPTERPEEAEGTAGSVTPEAAEPAPARARAAARPQSVAPPTDPSPDPPSEIELLREARAAVTSRPRRALALCRDHQRRYPNGVLGEEREVIAVKALIALGSRGEARRRAEAFLDTHGSSAHRAQIEALLEHASQENDPAAR